MQKIRSRVGLCTFILIFFFAGLLVFLNQYRKHAREWFLQPYNRHLYSQDNVLVSGTVRDRNGLILSTVNDGQRIYNGDETVRISTLHVVGDPYGKIGTSALATLYTELISYDRIRGIAAVSENGNTVNLTIDADLNAAAYEALDGRNGTVCVYNYKTGEIMALVSTPAYDPENIPEDLEENEAYSGVYLNRFFSTTATPGSVLKPVILQAALENLTASDIDPSQTGPISECRFNCKGIISFSDGYVKCPKIHGSQTLSETLANSCNCAYAAMAVALGNVRVSEYMQRSGLTSSYRVGAVNTARGTFSVTGVADYRLGYAGVGLYLDQVNPCSLMVYYAAVANGGTAAVPNTVRSVTDAKGREVYKPELTMTGKILSEGSSALIRQMLQNDVIATYGKDRFPCAIAAKSGTVERSGGASDSWFAGFTTDADKPYAFVVFIEHGGSGSRAAGSVAAEVLKALTSGQ